MLPRLLRSAQVQTKPWSTQRPHSKLQHQRSNANHPDDTDTVRSYYIRNGHELAQLDPLGLATPGKPVLPLDASPSTKERYHKIYSGNIGFEFDYLPDVERVWLQDRIEKSCSIAATASSKLRWLQLLLECQVRTRQHARL